MTEEENKEFEEFLEWKAEKKRKEEENKAKQEEAERQVKVNAQMPQVEEEKSMEFDNGQVPYSSNINDNKSNNPDGGTTSFPCAFVLLFSVIIFLFCICLLRDCSDNYKTTSNNTESTSNSEIDKDDSLATIAAAEKKSQDSLKRAKRIDLLKNTIKIKKAYLSSPNSAGGVDAHLVWKLSLIHI